MRMMHVAVGLVVLMALLVVFAQPAEGVRLDIALPSEVSVGDVLLVIIVGPPNTTFGLSVAGPGNFMLSEEHNLSREGVYRFYLPVNEEGEYLMTVLTVDDSQTRGVIVRCGTVCQSARLTTLLSDAQRQFFNWLGVMLVVVVLIEAFRMVELGKDKAEMGRQLGLPPARKRIISTMRGIRMFLPGALGARRVESNPRFAYQAERLNILDALARKTSQENRPIDYDPAYDQEIYQMVRAYASASKNLRDVLDGRRLKELSEQRKLPASAEEYLSDVPLPHLASPELVAAESQLRQERVRDVGRRMLKRISVVIVWVVALAPPMLDVLSRVGLKVWPASVVAEAASSLAGPMYLHLVYTPMVIMLFVSLLIIRKGGKE